MVELYFRIPKLFKLIRPKGGWSVEGHSVADDLLLQLFPCHTPEYCNVTVISLSLLNYFYLFIIKQEYSVIIRYFE